MNSEKATGRGSSSEVAMSWAWSQVRRRAYPAAVGMVLVYLAGKAKPAGDDGSWVAGASYEELAEVSGARIRTVRGVMSRLHTDGLVRTAPRELSASRAQRAMFIAVGDPAADRQEGVADGDE